jgi:hypothetical protein
LKKIIKVTIEEHLFTDFLVEIDYDEEGEDPYYKAMEFLDEECWMEDTELGIMQYGKPSSSESSPSAEDPSDYEIIDYRNWVKSNEKD